MPYKVISDNCVLRGKALPKGSVISDAQIVECCADALIKLKQIEPITASASAPAKPQAQKESSAN